MFALVLASGFCFALVWARAWRTGSNGYGFLVWNLELAWIPFVVAVVFYDSWRRGRSRWVLGALGVLWLLFLPALTLAGPADLGRELIVNGNFEQSADGRFPTGFSGDRKLVQYLTEAGNHFVRLGAPDRATNASVGQSPKLAPDWFKLKVRVKVRRKIHGKFRTVTRTITKTKIVKTGNCPKAKPKPKAKAKAKAKPKAKAKVKAKPRAKR